MIIICYDSIERNATKELLVVFWFLAISMDSGWLSEPHSFCWIELPLLIHGWCLQVVDCWWLVWTELLLSWQCRLYSFKRNLSIQDNIFLCPINLSFPLPLVSGRIEGRLKHLSAHTKSRLWKTETYKEQSIHEFQSHKDQVGTSLSCCCQEKSAWKICFQV